jgi:hypothetical protein
MVRGTVTAVQPEQFSVKTDAGDTYHIATSANTRLRKDNQPIKAADVKVGDSVGAMGVLDAPTKTVHAVFVVVVDAAQAKKMREDLGKTYIAGRVSAIDIDALKITVIRPDDISQVVAVDEGTSFRRGGRGMASMLNGGGQLSNGREDAGSGGESITLADIKIGDSIGGTGALKSGVFTAKELRVVDASARRRRQEDPGVQSPAGTPQKPQVAPSNNSPQ